MLAKMMNGLIQQLIDAEGARNQEPKWPIALNAMEWIVAKNARLVIN